MADVLFRLRDNLEVALDDMALRLSELGCCESQSDGLAFYEAVGAYDLARIRWLGAQSALRRATDRVAPR
jgi:hypothetical protein